MSNFRAMTRATEYGLENGVPEKYREWQPATWVDEKDGYIVLFDDSMSFANDYNDYNGGWGWRFECDEQMPLPEEKDSNTELTDTNVGNPLKKIINKLKSYCRRFI